MKRILSVFIIFLLSINFASAKIKLIEKSKRKKPKWITLPPEEKGYYYFIGVSQNNKNLGEGINKAIEEALKQVLSTIGVVVGARTYIEKTMKEDRTISKIIDEYKEVGRAKLRGHKIREIYTETYLDTETGERFYDVYVLLRYSEKEIKKERDRIKRIQAENRKVSQKYLEEAKEFEKNGKIFNAFKKYSDVINVLQDQPGIYQYNNALIGIKRILNGIVLKGKQEKRTIIVLGNCRIHEKSFPLDGIKLKAEISKGEGEIEVSSIFENGKCEFKIKKIKFEGGIAEITVFLDKEQFLSLLKNAYLSNQDLKALEEIIEEKKVKILISSSEFGFSKVCVFVFKKDGGRSSQAENIISKILIDSGIKVAEMNIPKFLNYKNFMKKIFFTLLRKKGVKKVIVGELEVIDNGKVY